jgi:hypothetical protein
MKRSLNNNLLHYEELHTLYYSPNIIRMIKPRRRWTGHVARMRANMNAYGVLIRKPKGKGPLGMLDVRKQAVEARKVFRCRGSHIL